jgi:plastin-1
MSKVNVEHHPGLARLIDEDEDVKDFVNLPPEVTLLRWVNYHLDNANHYRKVYNFGDDLKVF